MRDRYRIFVSSRMNGEVDTCRALIIRSIENLARETHFDLIPVVFEHEACPPSTTAYRASIEWVRSCDVFIGLYDKSVTPVLEGEFAMADSLHLPILLFARERHAGDLDGVDVTNYEALGAFLKTTGMRGSVGLSEGGYVYKVYSETNLPELIKNSFLEYLPRRFQFKRLPDEYLSTRLDEENLHRLERLYVPPSCYDLALSILLKRRILFLAGPAHTGKSSLASILVKKLLQDHVVRRVARAPRNARLRLLSDIPDTLVYFDDPFGGTQYDPSSAAFGDAIEELGMIAEESYVIVTSRSDVLDVACRRTKLGEWAGLSQSLLELTPRHYSKSDLAEILHRHIEEFVVDPALKSQLLDRSDSIVASRPFPHNYRVFIGTRLDRVTRGEELLEDVIRELTPIEQLVGNWFSRQYSDNKELFYFIFTLTLFPSTYVHEFVALHAAIVQRVRAKKAEDVPIFSSHDLRRLASWATVYVTVDRKVSFLHASYREGIARRLHVDFRGELEVVLDVIRDVTSTCPEIDAAALYPILADLAQSEPLLAMTLAKKWIVANSTRREDLCLLAGEIAATVPEIGIAVIEDLLQCENWGIRADARKMLSIVIKSNMDRGLSCVQKAMSQGPEVMVFESLRALEDLVRNDFDRVWPLLQELATYEDITVRKAVAIVLGCTQPSSFNQVEKVLQVLVEDVDWGVSKTAEASLDRIFKIMTRAYRGIS